MRPGSPAQALPLSSPARSEIKEDLADWLAETGWEGEQKAEDLADALTTWTQRSETAKLAALLDSMAARWPHVPELASKLVLPAAQCGHVAVIMLLHEYAPPASLGFTIAASCAPAALRAVAPAGGIPTCLSWLICSDDQL